MAVAPGTRRLCCTTPLCNIRDTVHDNWYLVHITLLRSRFPTRYAVPPVPQVPPLVRRLPQEARASSGAAERRLGQPAPDTAGVARSPPPLDNLIASQHAGHVAVRAAVRLASPTRAQPAGSAQPLQSKGSRGGSQVMEAAARIDQREAAVSRLSPGARRVPPPSLSDLQRARTPPRMAPQNMRP